MVKKNWFLWGILLFNILYALFFAFHFYQLGNFEFIGYLILIVILIVFFSLLNKRYNFTHLSLFGLSLWGFFHMLGGSGLFNPRLYSRILYNLVETGDVIVFSYDHLMHFYFYLVATAIIYQVFIKYLKKEYNWLPIAVLIFFTSMGVGAFNEFVEFMLVLFLPETGVGGYFNTLWDVVFNGLGTLVGLIYISIRKYYGR